MTTPAHLKAKNGKTININMRCNVDSRNKSIQQVSPNITVASLNKSASQTQGRLLKSAGTNKPVAGFPTPYLPQKDQELPLYQNLRRSRGGPDATAYKHILQDRMLSNAVKRSSSHGIKEGPAAIGGVQVGGTIATGKFQSNSRVGITIEPTSKQKSRMGAQTVQQLFMAGSKPTLTNSGSTKFMKDQHDNLIQYGISGVKQHIQASQLRSQKKSETAQLKQIPKTDIFSSQDTIVAGLTSQVKAKRNLNNFQEQNLHQDFFKVSVGRRVSNPALKQSQQKQAESMSSLELVAAKTVTEPSLPSSVHNNYFSSFDEIPKEEQKRVPVAKKAPQQQPHSSNDFNPYRVYLPYAKLLSDGKLLDKQVAASSKKNQVSLGRNLQQRNGAVSRNSSIKPYNSQKVHPSAERGIDAPRTRANSDDLITRLNDAQFDQGLREVVEDNPSHTMTLVNRVNVTDQRKQQMRPVSRHKIAMLRTSKQPQRQQKYSNRKGSRLVESSQQSALISAVLQDSQAIENLKRKYGITGALSDHQEDQKKEVSIQEKKIQRQSIDEYLNFKQIHAASQVQANQTSQPKSRKHLQHRNLKQKSVAVCYDGSDENDDEEIKFYVNDLEMKAESSSATDLKQKTSSGRLRPGVNASAYMNQMMQERLRNNHRQSYSQTQKVSSSSTGSLKEPKSTIKASEQNPSKGGKLKVNDSIDTSSLQQTHQAASKQIHLSSHILHHHHRAVEAQQPDQARSLAARLPDKKPQRNQDLNSFLEYDESSSRKPQRQQVYIPSVKNRSEGSLLGNINQKRVNKRTNQRQTHSYQQSWAQQTEDYDQQELEQILGAHMPEQQPFETQNSEDSGSQTEQYQKLIKIVPMKQGAKLSQQQDKMRQLVQSKLISLYESENDIYLSENGGAHKRGQGSGVETDLYPANIKLQKQRAGANRYTPEDDPQVMLQGPTSPPELPYFGNKKPNAMNGGETRARGTQPSQQNWSGSRHGPQRVVKAANQHQLTVMMAEDDELLKSFSLEGLDDLDIGLDEFSDHFHLDTSILTEGSKAQDDKSTQEKNSKECPSDDFLEVYNERGSERQAKEEEMIPQKYQVIRTMMTGEVRSPQFFEIARHEQDSSQEVFSQQQTAGFAESGAVSEHEGSLILRLSIP